MQYLRPAYDPFMKSLLLPLLLFLSGICPGQYLIEGVAPVAFRGGTVYLDVLNSHEEVRMISDVGMVMKSAPIDSLGRFHIAGQEFSRGDYMCRLRFVRPEVTPYTIYVERRHYLTFVTNGRDTLLSEGLRVIQGNSANQAINAFEIRLDEINAPLAGETTDRSAELLESGRLEFLRGTLTGNPDPYARIVALGHVDEPTLEDLHLVAPAIAEADLPYTFTHDLERLIAMLDYERLSRENGYLKLAVGVLLFLIATGFAALFYLRRKITSVAPAAVTPVDYGLTDKETEVMSLIAGGRTNREIADELFVAEATVKTHINNVYKKLGAKGRKEAVETWEEVKSTPV